MTKPHYNSWLNFSFPLFFIVLKNKLIYKFVIYSILFTKRIKFEMERKNWQNMICSQNSKDCKVQSSSCQTRPKKPCWTKSRSPVFFGSSTMKIISTRCRIWMGRMTDGSAQTMVSCHLWCFLGLKVLWIMPYQGIRPELRSSSLFQQESVPNSHKPD